MTDKATKTEITEIIGRKAVVTLRSKSVVEAKDGGIIIDVVLATESPCRRYEYEIGPSGEEIFEYDEVLLCNVDAIDTEYLDASMSVLDSHNQISVLGLFGEVLPDSISYDVGDDGVNRMIGKIKLNSKAKSSGIVDMVKDGSLKFLSIAGDIYRSFVSWDMSGAVPRMICRRWLPWEVSFVLVPADVKSRLRTKLAAATAVARSKEKTMPTAEEIAAARAIVEAADAETTATARAKEVADAATLKVTTDAADAAAATAAAEAAAKLQAERSKPVAETDAEYIDTLTSARAFGDTVVEAVRSAQKLGCTIDEVRHACRHAIRSRPQPKLDVNTGVVTQTDAEPGKTERAKPAGMIFDAYAIMAEQNEKRLARKR